MLEPVADLIEHNTLLHLATSKDDEPSVSLMNFTYIPPTELAPPTIVISSEPNTTKVENIKANPRVALLIHDWTNSVAQKPNDLSQILQNLNQAEVGRTSVTLYGNARIALGEEAEYYRAQHLQKHPNAGCFIRNGEVILVVPHRGRLADVKGNVQEFDL